MSEVLIGIPTVYLTTQIFINLSRCMPDHLILEPMMFVRSSVARRVEPRVTTRSIRFATSRAVLCLQTPQVMLSWWCSAAIQKTQHPKFQFSLQLDYQFKFNTILSVKGNFTSCSWVFIKDMAKKARCGRCGSKNILRTQIIYVGNSAIASLGSEV